VTHNFNLLEGGSICLVVTIALLGAWCLVGFKFAEGSKRRMFGISVKEY